MAKMKKTAKKKVTAKTATRPTLWATRDRGDAAVELWVGPEPTLDNGRFGQWPDNTQPSAKFFRTRPRDVATIKGFNLWDLKPGQCRKVEVK